MSVYIVTGTSKGIGLAISESIIQLGGKVIGLARSEPLLKDIQAKLGKDKFEFVAGDITDSQVHNKVVELAASAGEIKGIVHNAAVLSPDAKLEDTKLESIKGDFNINLFSIIDLTQKALPHLKVTNGNIILVSSGAGVEPIQGWASYCLSKAALNMLSSLLAIEYPNIRTLSVDPGIMDTNMQAQIRETGSAAMNPEHHQFFQDLVSNGNLIHPSLPGSAIGKLVMNEIPKSENGKFVNWSVKF
ncbi:NAD(P)-binding protein [Conidiobolus coronatus NRRL 28638]|uniref:NAD(P)-binding protein n=1 Tax=Conidiobolus coronatus (strain ATCC 28846 / CBS 209.66 / NRRL 28638) TaxID=796925 RepID=A0A137NX36_CONC2|nr:NAD(P)-binding protein [Conidiobolus coronatus NRRL 28638]|eukprot:KXN67204.1 NAD(P)-binding protein [Conidiobolus coronatus NRRL 28638]